MRNKGETDQQRPKVNGGPFGMLIYDGPPIADGMMSPRDATRANIEYWRGYQRQLAEARQSVLSLVETDLAEARSAFFGFLDRELDEAEIILGGIRWRYKFDIQTGVGYGDDFRGDPEAARAVVTFATVYGQKMAIVNAAINAMDGNTGTNERDEIRAGINAYFDAYEKYPGSFGVPIKKPLYPGQTEAGTYNVAGWIGASTSLKENPTTGKPHAPRLLAAMKQDDDDPNLALADQLPGATFEVWAANDKFDPEGVRRAVRRLLERREPDPGTTVPFHDENAVQVPGPEEFAARDQVREQNMAAFVELREMACLTKLENRILDMHLEERPAKEIARALGATTTENSVNQAMHRIRGKIREAAETSA